MMLPVGHVEGQRVYFDTHSDEFVKRREDGTRVRIHSGVQTNYEIEDREARRLFRDNYKIIAQA